MRRNTWALVGLSALAVATAVLVLLSLLHVRPNSVEALPAQPLPRTTDTVRESARPSPSPSSSPGASRESNVANIERALRGAEPITILVLGDASGMDDSNTRETRWVTRWAEHLAQSRPVTVAAVESDGTYAEPRRFGTGTAAPIEIFNAGDRPSTLAAAAAQADTLIPADVDLVIISFGHREPTPSEMPADLDALWAKFPQGAMGVVIAQNPERWRRLPAQRNRAQAVSRWAEQNDVPFVDVFNAFIAAPEPLVELLSADLINPNDRGSEVWRDAMVAALG